MSRKIVQISGEYDRCFVLCDDQSFWYINQGFGGYKWNRLPDLPQD